MSYLDCNIYLNIIYLRFGDRKEKKTKDKKDMSFHNIKKIRIHLKTIKI